MPPIKPKNSTDGGSNTGWIFKKAPNFLLMF